MGRLKQKKSFTIIELVIVILVLTILIGITVPRIKGFQQNVNLVKASKEAVTIETALESYYMFNSHVYPPSTSTVQTVYLTNAVPNVISNVFYDPFGATSTTEYNYLCSSNGQYYVVWSVGVSGQSQPTAISNTGDISF